MIYCNEWRTEKRHECANMGKVKRRLELWWQLYRMSLPVWDLENFRPMDFCWHECTGKYNILFDLLAKNIVVFDCIHKFNVFFQFHNTSGCPLQKKLVDLLFCGVDKVTRNLSHFSLHSFQESNYRPSLYEPGMLTTQFGTASVTISDYCRLSVKHVSKLQRKS